MGLSEDIDSFRNKLAARDAELDALAVRAGDVYRALPSITHGFAELKPNEFRPPLPQELALGESDLVDITVAGNVLVYVGGMLVYSSTNPDLQPDPILLGASAEFQALAQIAIDGRLVNPLTEGYRFEWNIDGGDFTIIASPDLDYPFAINGRELEHERRAVGLDVVSLSTGHTFNAVTFEVVTIR